MDFLYLPLIAEAKAWFIANTENLLDPWTMAAFIVSLIGKARQGFDDEDGLFIRLCG